jgi:hypothetical protein
VFSCIKLLTGLFFSVKTAANENVVHYLSRYNSTRFVPDLPKEHLEHLFSEEYERLRIRFLVCQIWK